MLSLGISNRTEYKTQISYTPLDVRFPFHTHDINSFVAKNNLILFGKVEIRLNHL